MEEFSEDEGQDEKQSIDVAGFSGTHGRRRGPVRKCQGWLA